MKLKLLMRNLSKKSFMVAALLLLSTGLAGCWSDSGLWGSDEGVRSRQRLCLDRVKQENALYLKAIDSALPAANRVALGEWNGCDSANNGAALYVDVNPNLKQKKVRETFEKFGWSSKLAIEAAKECGLGCGEILLAKKVGHRVIGMAFEESSTESVPTGQSPGVSIMVQAVDMCWDDNGYRCR
jgi:hypothetical protein